MARHIYLSEDRVPTPTPEFLATVKHAESARVAAEILQTVSDIEVRDIQIPADSLYTCWYVSLTGLPKLPIINFSLQANANLNIEFRYIQFVPPTVRDRLQWQTQNWPYARISGKGFIVSDVIEMIKQYVPKCRAAASNGLLKKGGTSAAETVLCDILLGLGISSTQGERPEWLRNDEGNLLQLDFQLVNHGIAIEVQGPHHKLDLFGKPDQLTRRQDNDMFKANACLNRGLSLIWMDAEGIQRHLVRMPFRNQMTAISEVLKQVRAHHPCHASWMSPTSVLSFRPLGQK